MVGDAHPTLTEQMPTKYTTIPIDTIGPAGRARKADSRGEGGGLWWWGGIMGRVV